MIKIKQIPVLNDNYVYIIIDKDSGISACIDPSLAEPVIDYLEKKKIILDFILITHHHFDHVGGNIELKAKYGCKIVGNKEDKKRIPGIDILLSEGDKFKLGNSECEIIEVSGHTLGHISYFFGNDKSLFCGDTLFSLGCGRIFEGTPKQMVNSLIKIRNLPDDTMVFCGHEYSSSNAKFAISLDPKNKYLKKRIKKIKENINKGKPTVPFELGEDKLSNPFLRFDDKDFTIRIEMDSENSVENFRIIREMKDNF